MQNNYLYTNFSYDPDIYYFFYIGELKSLGLANFLSRPFGQITDKRVECIAIVPDIHAQYNYSNIIVPGLEPEEEMRHDLPAASFRRDTATFLRTVSADESIQALIDQILAHQDELYIYMFESATDMTLDQRKGVYLLGPEKELAKKFNNKAVQFELLDRSIPLVDFRICSSRAELLKVTAQLRAVWQDGIFVSRVYSAAGSGSIITTAQSEVESFFSDNDAPFLITRYIPHEHDPTVLAVVANDHDVYIAGIADQRIEGGNRFVGSSWPSVLAPTIQAELAACTRQVGQLLGRHGYRGIFGCDYIVTADGQVRFIEINARKQGTTYEFCCALEQILPAGSPSLPELEYYAVRENRFPATMVEPPIAPAPILYWGTYNYKLKERRRTCGYIPQAVREQERFASVASGRLQKDFLVLEHVGSGMEVWPGTFLARVVAIGKDPRNVDEGLELGRKLIELTIEE